MNLPAAKIERGNVRRTVRALEVAAVTGRAFSSFAERWAEYPPEPVRAAGIRMDQEMLRERIEARQRIAAWQWEPKRAHRRAERFR